MLTEAALPDMEDKVYPANEKTAEQQQSTLRLTMKTGFLQRQLIIYSYFEEFKMGIN